MIENEQYSKEEYEKRRDALKLNTRAGIEAYAQKIATFFGDKPRRALIVERAEGCTGDRIYDCKNAVNCFDVKDIEDCRHCQKLSLSCKTCMDFNSWGQASELVYQCSACGDRAYNAKFCSTCITVSNAQYSFECFHCKDIFGCAGLKGRQYCILNKQLSKEEYEEMLPKVIQHMKKTGEYGEYFPMAQCPFAYNESFAPDLFPMTKDDVLARGWRWYEEQETDNRYMGADTALPETAADTKSTLTKKILLCGTSKKPYKIIPQELAFYRSMDLPPPALCPDERHRRRMARRNPYALRERTCGKCGDSIATTYAPDRAAVVYCNACYLATVY
jgi:hypothetical protein